MWVKCNCLVLSVRNGVRNYGCSCDNLAYPCDRLCHIALAFDGVVVVVAVVIIIVLVMVSSVFDIVSLIAAVAVALVVAVVLVFVVVAVTTVAVVVSVIVVMLVVSLILYTHLERIPVQGWARYGSLANMRLGTVV